VTTRPDLATAALTPGDWARVRGLAEDALGMPRAARAAFLDPRCRGDRELLARVERLMAACERVEERGDFLARPAGELAASLVAEAARAGGDAAASRCLGSARGGRYRLECEIGVGGTATVFRAYDIRHERRVAIKVLHPEVVAAFGAERFLAEIRTMASLLHPHILPLLDSGSANGLLFYVMPLVDDSLRARLAREGRLAVVDAVRIARDVAGAIDYAHRRGVIHRDIKPGNVLLHEGRALVADFGIALATPDLAGAHDVRITLPGLSLGTPSYMSPEQARGERLLTARSDVHALGVLTFEMLTGAPPFAGATAKETARRVRTAHPPAMGPPGHVPPHVEAAVLTALAKAPEDRFGSAAEFARALDDVERGRTSRTNRGRRHVPRALVGALAAVGLAVVAAWGWTRGERPVQDASVDGAGGRRQLLPMRAPPVSVR